VKKQKNNKDLETEKIIDKIKNVTQVQYTIIAPELTYYLSTSVVG